MEARIITLSAPLDGGSSLRVATFEEAFGEFSEARGRGRQRRANRRSDRVQKRKERRLERIGARDEVKRSRRESKISRRADRKGARQDMRDSQAQRRQERKTYNKESRLSRKSMGDEEPTQEGSEQATQDGYSDQSSEQGYSEQGSEQGSEQPSDSGYSDTNETGGGIYGGTESYSEPQSYSQEESYNEQGGGYDDQGGGYVPEDAYESEESYGDGESENSEYGSFNGSEDFYGIDAVENVTTTSEPKTNEGIVEKTPEAELKPSPNFTAYTVVKGGWLWRNQNGKLIRTNKKVVSGENVGVTKDTLTTPMAIGKRPFVKLRRGTWVALDRLTLRVDSSFEGNDYYSAEGDVVSPSVTSEPIASEGVVSVAPASEMKPSSDKTKHKVVKGGWLWRNQNGKLLKTNQKISPNQTVNVFNETLSNPILMGKDKKRPFVKLGRGLWVALDRLNPAVSSFDGDDIELGAEDYYMNADGEKKAINPKVKEVAKKIEWNKELISRLNNRLSEVQNPSKKEEITQTVEERTKRIAELESLLGSYSSANGNRRNEQNRIAEIRRAKRLARKERAKATGVDAELNPSIEEQRIEIPASSDFTGINGVDNHDDYDAPEPRKFEIGFSNASGDKPKTKINYKAIGIGVGAGLLLIGGILLYKKYKK